MVYCVKFLAFTVLILYGLLDCVECKGKQKNQTTLTNRKLKTKSSSLTNAIKPKKSVSSSRDKEIFNAIKVLRNYNVIESNVKLIRKGGKYKLGLHSKSEKIIRTSKNLSEMINTLSSNIAPTVFFNNGFTREQSDKAVEIIRDSLRQSNITSELAECLRDELDKEMSMKSDVIITSKSFMDQSLAKIPGRVSMALNFENKKSNDQVVVTIVGTRDDNLDKRADLLMQRAKKLSPKLIDSLMSADMKQEAVKLATRIVRNAESMAAISDQLSDVLDDKFGAHWHAVVSNKNTLAIDDHRKNSVFYLNMDFGDMRVSIFK